MQTIRETQSVCPVCLQRLPARYIERDGAVYFEKTCPAHGDFSVLAARDAALFRRWLPETVNIPPKRPLTQTDKGCPYDCGPCQSHVQTACCVLLEVTQRCNQHCPYCYASAGEAPPPDPTLEEIEAWLDFLVAEGEATRPFNIQLSGGEPTVRDDLPQIVRMAVQKSFPYIQLNTNGRRLADAAYAQLLADAGVSAVFLQFDGTTDDIHRATRGEALLATKLKAIENCRAARLPVALVPTVIHGVNHHDIGNLLRFAEANVDIVKGVHFQPVSYFGRHPGDDGRYSMFDLMSDIQAQTDGRYRTDDFWPITAGHGLCCFTGAFLTGPGGSVRATQQAAAGCCDTLVDPATVIARDRDFVKSKWSLAEPPPADCCGGPLSALDGFDAFLQDVRGHSLTITGMHFQDAWTLDLERAARCRVQIYRGGHLIPFCTYNLTDQAGTPLYRGAAPPAP